MTLLHLPYIFNIIVLIPIGLLTLLGVEKGGQLFHVIAVRLLGNIDISNVSEFPQVQANGVILLFPRLLCDDRIVESLLNKPSPCDDVIPS